MTTETAARYLLTRTVFGKTRYGSVYTQAKKRRFVWTEKLSLAEKFRTLEEIEQCVEEFELLDEVGIAIVPEHWAS